MPNIWPTVRDAMSRGIIGSPVLDEVWFYPPQGGAWRVRGELRRPYAAQLGGEANDATFSTREESIYGLDTSHGASYGDLHGATLVLGNESWVVMNVEPDGEGWMLFQLNVGEITL